MNFPRVWSQLKRGIGKTSKELHLPTLTRHTLGAPINILSEVFDIWAGTDATRLPLTYSSSI